MAVKVVAPLAKIWRRRLYQFWGPKWIKSSCKDFRIISLVVCQDHSHFNTRSLYQVPNSFHYFRRDESCV